MAYTIDKSTGDLVINGWEKGIALSPHLGIANMQSVNIETETGEVMCAFSRTLQSQATDSGTLTFLDASTVTASGQTSTLKIGSWITISGSTITNLPSGDYYVVDGNLGNNQRYNLKASYTNTNDYISIMAGPGTATFNTTSFDVGSPVASATETYTDSSGASAFRYYVLDSNGRVWVSDSSSASVVNITKPLWYLPYTNTVTSYGGGATNVSGMAVLNGWLFVFGGNKIFCKPTVNLAASWSSTPFALGTTMGLSNNTLPHTAYVGHQGKLYYCDGTYIGSIFPNTSLITGVNNIQSYASYTAVATTGTISTLISGSLPATATSVSTTRIPAVFFPAVGGTKPNAITVGTVYYIDYTPGLTTSGNFEVYAAITGGAALDIQTGAVGTQYFNTFYPSGSPGATLMTFTPQRFNLPVFETAQSLAELGNIVLVGCKGNVVYPWNQVAVLPSSLINIPENNVVKIITVNNMGFLLAGSKGNIYITNGSSASGVISVPDYCAGIAGTQASYIEPYFTWGDVSYIRGRVYFSILDQTSTKSGNCGGIWSFTPTQNMFYGDNTGLSLRLENQNSYGTYGGVANVILPSQNQGAIAPQYWSAWYSSITSPTYGIDFTNTTPSTAAIIESDLVPTGHLLGEQKKTFQNIEYKLSNPLANGETIAIAYRKNSTESYTDLGVATTESATDLSGYFTASFENTRWLQLKITMTPLASSTSSFCRLTEVRVR